MISINIPFGASGYVYTALRTWGSLSILPSANLAAGDFTISKDGGAFANLATLPSYEPTNGGVLRITLSATEATARSIAIKLVDQTVPKEWEDDILFLQTYGNLSSSYHPYIGNNTLIASAVWNSTTASVSSTSTMGGRVSTYLDGSITRNDTVIASGTFISAYLIPSTSWDITYGNTLAGCKILVTTGSGRGQTRIITGYVTDDAPDVGIEISSDWTTAPIAGDGFKIFSDNRARISTTLAEAAYLDTGAITSGVFAASAITNNAFVATPTIAGVADTAAKGLKISLADCYFSTVSEITTGYVTVNNTVDNSSFGPVINASGLVGLLGASVTIIGNYGGSIRSIRTIQSVGFSTTGYTFYFDRPVAQLDVDTGVSEKRVLIDRRLTPSLDLNGKVFLTSGLHTGAAISYVNLPGTAIVTNVVSTLITTPVTAMVNNITELVTSFWSASASSYSGVATMGGRVFSYLNYTLSSLGPLIWSYDTTGIQPANTAVQNLLTILGNTSGLVTTSGGVYALLSSGTHVGAIIPTVTTVTNPTTAIVTNTVTLASAVHTGATIPTVNSITNMVTATIFGYVILSSGTHSGAIIPTINTVTNPVTAFTTNTVNATITSPVTAFTTNTVNATITSPVTGIVTNTVTLSSGLHTGAIIPNVTEVASASLLLTQTIPASNTAQTVGDALNAARADGFGRWVLSGTTLTMYAADGLTVVRTFTLDNSGSPSQRS